jgi:outer membrane receptor protein involved in Fe transport
MRNFHLTPSASQYSLIASPSARRLLAVAITATLVAASHAQPTAPAATTRSTDVTLEPVVVTGEKITRSASETTSSVGVVNARQIEETGVRNLPDLFRLLGNVRDADFVDSGIIIRGINSEGVGGPAGRPLATVYVDGIAQTDQGVRRGALGLWDMEQVEVFRGPQSTVSGRNALAGAIRMKSKDPTFERENAVQLRGGDQSSWGAAGMTSGAVSDRLAVRVAAEASHARGFVNYPLYDGLPKLDERKNDDYWQVRGKALWQSRAKDGVTLLFTHASAYDSPSYDDVDGPSSGVNWFDRQWGAQTLPVFVEARSSRNDSTSLEATVPLSSALKLTSLTTRVQSRTERPSVDLATQGLIQQTELAQEFRINYDTRTLKTVVGAYVNRETSSDDRDQIRPFAPTILRRDERDGRVNNAALFGEINWTTGDLTWIAGARYDREKQTSSSVASRINVATNAVTSSLSSATSAKYSAFLPKLGINYALGREHSIGAVAQRAYRAGGAAINPETDLPYEYKPETANNIELSYRWESSDRRLRVAANVFQMDWKNQQVNVPLIPGDFTSDIILNAGKSRLRGGEIELRARPQQSLDVYTSLGIAETKFVDFSFVQFGSLLSLNGLPFPQAPKVTASVGADWKVGAWSIGGDLKYTGRALSRSVFEGVPPDYLPNYTLANLRAAYRTGNYRFSVFANNVTNERHFLYRFDDPSFQVGTVGKGRTLGVSFDATF